MKQLTVLLSVIVVSSRMYEFGKHYVANHI